MNRRFLALFFSLFLFACNEGKKTEEDPVALPPQYYYFPRANVYFDSANKEYLFLANDSVGWQTAKQIPNVVQGLMDKSVFIQSPPQPVWTDNDKHKLVYSALLYATPEDTAKKKEPLKQVEREAGEPVAKEKRPRKGLRKFVDKVFGVFKKDKTKKDTIE